MAKWWERLLPKPEPAPKLVWKSYAAVEERVREITASNAGLHAETITADTDFDDIDDSVGNLEIVMECEEVFDIEVSDDAANTLLTVGQLTHYIAERLNLAPAQNQQPAPKNNS